MKLIVLLAALFLAVFARPVLAADHRAHPRQDKASLSALIDPGAVVGTLPNGMRYVVMHNAKPTGALSIRFDFFVGSLDETEGERGVAHFLEHMAFEGGERLSGDQVMSRFQEAGVSMERDRNAFTTLDHTFYVLDLSDINPGKFDLAFSWLRDVADGLEIAPEAVDHQRGVVISEYSVRRNAATEVAEQIGNFLTPGRLAPRRSPAGTPASLKGLTAADLKRFYHRWYRPERAFIVVAGDEPVEVLKRKVEETFSSWKGEGPAPNEPALGEVDYKRQSAFFQLFAPNFTEGTLQVCRFRPDDPKPEPGLDAMRKAMERTGWMEPLNLRFRKLARAADAPIITAQVVRNNLQHQVAETCIVAVPKPEKWREAMTLLSDEVRKLQLYGVSEDELADSRASLESQLRFRAETERTTPQIAGELLANMREKEPIFTPAAGLALFNLVPPDRAAVMADFNRTWTTASPEIFALVSNAKTPPSGMEAAWKAALARPDPAPDIAKTVAWAYPPSDKPGRIVETTTLVDPAFTRVKFENGVIANIKRLPVEKGRVEIRVRFGAGQLQYSPGDLTAAAIGASDVLPGGLVAEDYESVERIARRHALGLQFSIQRDHFSLSGAARTTDAPLLASIMTAYLTAPGFRTEVEAFLPEQVRTYYAEFGLQPELAAQMALQKAVPSIDVGPTPPEDKLLALKAADLRRLFEPVFTRAPLEVTLVGDITDAQAEALLGATFGVMAPRQADFPARAPDAVVIRYPDKAVAPVEGLHKGLSDRAAVVVAWPTFPWVSERQREVRDITLLREVMSDRITRQIREKLGQTYTPSMGYDTDQGGDQGSLHAVIQTSPSAAKQVADEVLLIAADLAQNGVDPAELERVRKPILDDAANRREQIGWWLNTLDGSAADPYKLAQARTWTADYSRISAEEVGRAARTWLAKTPFIAYGLPAPGAPSGTGFSVKAPVITLPTRLPPLVIDPSRQRPFSPYAVSRPKTPLAPFVFGPVAGAPSPPLVAKPAPSPSGP